MGKALVVEQRARGEYDRIVAASSSTRYLSLQQRLYDLEEAHERSRLSRAAIERGATYKRIAGCFCCQKLFSASDVLEFLRDPERAICPLCHVDAVLLDDPSFPVNSRMLAACRRHHFY